MSTGPRSREGPQPKGPQKKPRRQGALDRRPAAAQPALAHHRWASRVSSSSRRRSATRSSAVGGGGTSTRCDQAARGCGLHGADGRSAAVRRPLGPDPRRARRRSGTPPRRRAARTTSSGRSGARTRRRSTRRRSCTTSSTAASSSSTARTCPQATVDQLKAFYDDHLNGTLLAPLPQLGAKIALGVWTTRSLDSPNSGTAHLAKCTTFDEKALRGVLRGVPVQGARALPGEHADARHVAIAADI